MRYRDTTERQALQLKLDAMRRQVLDELRATAPSVQTALAEGDHEVRTQVDEAEADRSAAVHMAEVEADRVRLEEVEQAIVRLAVGHYGFCEDCGAEIPRTRLLAQPTAIRCTACQATVEARRWH